MVTESLVNWRTYFEDGHGADNAGHDHETSPAEEGHQSDPFPHADICLPQ